MTGNSIILATCKRGRKRERERESRTRDETAGRSEGGHGKERVEKQGGGLRALTARVRSTVRKRGLRLREKDAIFRFSSDIGGCDRVHQLRGL